MVFALHLPIIAAILAVAQAEQWPLQTQNIAFDLPDVTTKIKTPRGEAQIEAFKALTNDRILNLQECRLPQRNSQLFWVSIGNPMLLSSKNNGTLQTIHKRPSGFHVFVDMLTTTQSEVLAESASLKYGITIDPRQIVHLVLSRFECTIDLYENGEKLILKGRVREFRNYPLRVDFIAPVGTLERRVFERTIDSGEHIDIDCQLASEGQQLRVNTLTITAKEIQALELAEKLFGPSHSMGSTVFVTREQMNKLSNEIYSSLSVVEEYDMPQYEFANVFVEEIIKQTAVSAFRHTPLNVTLADLSRFGTDFTADLQPDELTRHLGEVIKIDVTNNRSHLVVNQQFLDSGRRSSNSAASSNYFSLFPLSLSTSFVTTSQSDWTRGSKSLDSQLKELNTASVNEAQWLIEGKKVVPKSLYVAKLSRSNFSRTLTFSRVRRQLYDSPFIRTLVLYGAERKPESTASVSTQQPHKCNFSALISAQQKEVNASAMRLQNLESRFETFTALVSKSVMTSQGLLNNVTGQLNAVNSRLAGAETSMRSSIKRCRICANTHSGTTDIYSGCGDWIQSTGYSTRDDSLNGYSRQRITLDCTN